MNPSPREKSIGGQMHIALQLMKRRNQQALVGEGISITMEQIAILEILYHNGPMKMSEISKYVWKQNANITRMIDLLEKQNLVSRNAYKGDRRAYKVEILAKGIAEFEKAIPIIQDTYAVMTKGLSKEEHDITLQSIRKIVQKLDS